jgi:16S rRNA (guanine527-N7)-methyltransferase
MAEADLAQRLSRGAVELGIELDADVRARLLAYLDLMIRWNRVYNLTAVREPSEMLGHHLLDSLAVLKPLRRYTGGEPVRLLDVGSGGGLPGVVLAIAAPEIDVLCVDAVAKKAAFIQQVSARLDLPNLRGLHARVESVREPFDVITSRAFASLAQFAAWSESALAPGGVWMAMKGRRPEDEMAELPAGIEVFHVEPLDVPGLDAERCLVWMQRRAPD